MARPPAVAHASTADRACIFPSQIAAGTCARRSQCTAYGRCSAFSGVLFKRQHTRTAIVPSPVAAAFHSAAQQVAVEVPSTPTHTPAAQIVTPPLPPPRSLSPSARLPRHRGFRLCFRGVAGLASPTRRRFVRHILLTSSSRKGPSAEMRKRAFVSSDRHSFRIDVSDRSCA